ncbi:hypothetical protein [Mycobacterium uberis]|nr:hypothetical protein [Mycobacterium uberis]
MAISTVACIVDLGLNSDSMSWPMNTADNKGRANLRVNMVGGLAG